MPCSEWLRQVTGDNAFRWLGSSTVSGYEIFQDARLVRLAFRFTGVEQLNSQAAELIRSFWRPTMQTGVGGQVRCRLIVVQDLCRPVIDVLGAAIQVDPLTFIQHLQESPTNLRDEWISPPVDKYFVRNITTLRWYRPVFSVLEKRQGKKRKALFKLSDSDSDAETEDDEFKVEDWHAHTDQRNLEGGRRRRVNIFREEWAISIKAARRRDKKTSLVPSCWLEKATIYKEHVNGIESGRSCWCRPPSTTVR